MNGDALSLPRLHLALVLLSAALIAFQLEQMLLLGFVQWHHFAYLVISVALLGFGAGGTLIALFRATLLRNLPWLLPLLMFDCAIMMALAMPISKNLISAFDIGLLFVQPGQAGLLLAGQFVYLLIFFLGSLPLGLVFIHYSSRIGSLYSANLFGSGIGGIAAVFLMYFLLPRELPALTSLLPWAAGVLVIPRGRPLLLLIAGVSLVPVGAVIVDPPAIEPSQYKAVSRALDLPGAGVVANRPSPYGLVQLVSAPALRHAPGLSLTYEKEVPGLSGAVFSSGDWFGPVREGDWSLLNASASFLPYALAGRNRVLVLQAGTGMDVIQALENGAGKVVAVEPHQRAVEILFSPEVEAGSGHFRDPAVDLSHLYPRTWLATDKELFDLITLPVVGSFGGTSGLFALQEQYLLTLEGFREMWDHLAPNGILRVSAWLDSPSRNSLRLAATIAETMARLDVDYRSHVAAVRGWDMITFIMKRSPFTPEEISKIRAFCTRMQFDPVLLPGLEEHERRQYHFSPDRSFSDNLDSIFSPTRRPELYREYEFNLQPVTDNRPFFSQFLRWQSIPHLVRQMGQHTVPFLELGYVLVLVGFVQMVLAAGLLILLPLLRLGLPAKNGVQRWIVPFFSCLGLGYMFFEIVLIHELVFFFGNPIIAASAVISTLLIFSGLGSLFSGRLAGPRPNHAKAAAVVALILLLNLIILQPVLSRAIGFAMPWKILIFLLLTAPPAFAMGMPFPLGLARLAGRSKSQAAWAWGINGSVSVVSTGLAAIVAVELGFSAVMLISCGAYGLAALTGYKG
ncbi:MAG: hypothetical protein M8357_11785 [Desulfobulbaceae bacterium]|nr:hypothetical protein [Desulfobulbaceae bacterium]